MSKPDLNHPEHKTFVDPLINVMVDCRPHRLTVLTVIGEVDLATAPTLRAEVTRQVTDCRTLVIDLNRVLFLGSAGLSALVDALRQAEQFAVRLRLVAGTRTVARPLAILGFSDLFDIYPSLAEALRT